MHVNYRAAHGSLLYIPVTVKIKYPFNSQDLGPAKENLTPIAS